MQSRHNPIISSQTALEETFDFNKIPLAPPGWKVAIHENIDTRGTWAPYGLEGWYIGPDMDNYRCHQVYEVRSTINFPGYRVSGFAGNLCAKKLNKAQTKRANITGNIVFLRVLVLFTRASTGVVSTSSYHLSYIHHTFSQFAPTSLFVSTSTTDRVHYHR